MLPILLNQLGFDVVVPNHSPLRGGFPSPTHLRSSCNELIMYQRQGCSQDDSSSTGSVDLKAVKPASLPDYPQEGALALWRKSADAGASLSPC